MSGGVSLAMKAYCDAVTAIRRVHRMGCVRTADQHGVQGCVAHVGPHTVCD